MLQYTPYTPATLYGAGVCSSAGAVILLHGCCNLAGYQAKLCFHNVAPEALQVDTS